MSTLAVILVVLGALLAILFVGGLVAVSRRHKATEARFREQIRVANEALATAHAADKGWDRGLLERAVAEAVGATPDALELLAVVDRPGTAEDEAVFRVVVGGRDETVTLGRRDDHWHRIK